MITRYDNPTEGLSFEAGPAVLCLGNFDGVHSGHRKLIGEARQLADELGLSLRVISFHPHPRVVLGDTTFRPIYEESEKVRLMEETGLVDELLTLEFSRELMRMDPELFYQSLLLGRYHAAAIAVGDDYHFGYHGAGNPALLTRLSEAAGIPCRVVDRLVYEGEPVSSTRIRESLESGDVSKAAALLGRPYYLVGTVSQGKHLGRKFRHPTVNVFLKEDLLHPRYGVYASRTTVVGAGGETLEGITNVGVNPTFGGEAPRAETFLFDYSGDLYGKTLRVELLNFIRPEKTFESAKALGEEINRNIRAAEDFFDGHDE